MTKYTSVGDVAQQPLEFPGTKLMLPLCYYFATVLYDFASSMLCDGCASSISNTHYEDSSPTGLVNVLSFCSIMSDQLLFVFFSKCSDNLMGCSRPITSFY